MQPGLGKKPDLRPVLGSKVAIDFLAALSEFQCVTLLHQPQAVCYRHLSPVKDIKIFWLVLHLSLYGVLY